MNIKDLHVPGTVLDVGGNQCDGFQSFFQTRLCDYHISPLFSNYVNISRKLYRMRVRVLTRKLYRPGFES